MNTMKKTLSALAAVLALAASGMEWSFDGPEPLRSEDGKTVLTGLTERRISSNWP